MKPVEGDHILKDINNSDEQKKSDEPHPSSSKGQNTADTDEPSCDDTFEPTVDMLVNDFDEEQTLEEEEALAAKDGHDPGEELNDLQRESEMPLEELLKLYGCAPPMVASTSTSRKRRRRGHDKSPPPPPKQTKKQVNLPQEESSGSAAVIEDPVTVEESLDDDATTTTTNNIENTSFNDDETNLDEEDEEPSELKKLYTEGDKIDATVSDDEDLDYIPDEEDGKKTIMVGSDYQAQIPEGI